MTSIASFSDFVMSTTEAYIRGPREIVREDCPFPPELGYDESPSKIARVKKAQKAKLEKMGKQMIQDMEDAIWEPDEPACMKMWLGFVKMRPEFLPVPTSIVRAACPQILRAGWSKNVRFKMFKDALMPLYVYVDGHREAKWRLAPTRGA